MIRTKLTASLTLLMLSVTLIHCDNAEDEPTQANNAMLDMTGKDSDGDADMATDLSKDQTKDTTQDADMKDMSGCGGEVDKSDLGGERPAKIYFPPGYDGCAKAPLVILLHGYGASGKVQNAYFGLSRNISELGFILVTPDGQKDTSGKRFWNASEACCDFGNTNVDDVGYLRGLIQEAKMRHNIDDRRVYFIGHSNGGFMSYRMACEASDMIAGIVSLAGAAQTNATSCTPTSPVAVLQIHGTEDETIAYEGGTIGQSYPSAEDSSSRWAKRNECDEMATDGGMLTLLRDSTQPDTTVKTWKNCKNGSDVALWTIVDGSHIPVVKTDFGVTALKHVFQFPKPEPSN